MVRLASQAPPRAQGTTSPLPQGGRPHRLQAGHPPDVQGRPSRGRSDPKSVEFFLPPDLADAELGAKARAALAASRFIAPDHPEWDAIMLVPPTDEVLREWNRRMLDAAGVKTLKASRLGARNVILNLQDGLITVAPWQQRGGGGWPPLDRSLSVMVPEATPNEALGRAVREALSRSR